MLIREVRLEEKQAFNKVVTHPLQSWEWGDFREKTGVKVVRLGQFEGQNLTAGYQITFHKIPKFDLTVGYLPKSEMPTKKFFEALKTLGQQEKAIFIKLEPNVGAPINPKSELSLAKKKLIDFILSQGCVYGRPQFTKYTFQIDLSENEEKLLAQMKSKTRYNTRLAKRKGVQVSENNSDEAFEVYLDLTFETTKRQKFYAHTREYHRKMWQTLRPAGMAHLLTAKYKSKVLAAWILFEFNKVLYYPYGASSSEHREVMASNLMMWEAIRLGKRLDCKTFDMWGCLGPEPDKRDPWLGFHRFKSGYGPTLVEFLGTFDFIIDQPKYKLYKIAENLRWKYLRLKTVLPF